MLRAGKAFACAALLGSALAGCAPHATVNAPGRRTIDLTILEYRLAPHTVITSAGEHTFVVSNDGILTHDFEIGDGSAQPVAKIPAIPPGTTAKLTVKLAAGEYTLASMIQADQQLGIQAKLTVNSR